MSEKVYDDVPMADSRKPSVDEPYRYESPCCHQQVNRDHRTTRGYTCNGCGERWPMDELYDKKLNVIVGQRALTADD